ncbi:MAG TPA: hypothetical protein PKE45_07015 [Caldilineaceae bacterium]|nr:hypothetical protein [Caldilineaceae bacterium]
MSSVSVATYPRPARLVSAVATAVALCILGDSLLYSILPLEAARLGIPLALVGVLLSANRLVRLATNGIAGMLFEQWGPHLAFLGACALGLFSTSLYGLSQGFLLFLAARILWGAAWSSLRQGGYQAVWSGEVAQKGRLTGLLWGIIRLGSAVAVLAGGVLYDRYGFRTTLFCVTAVTALALPVAFLLPWPNQVAAMPAVSTRRVRWPQFWQDVATSLAEPRSRWLTLAGGLQLLSSSVVIATSSLLLASLAGSDQAIVLLGIGTVAGLLQGVRWLSDITIGPALGAFSDRVGQANLALALICLSVGSMVGLIVLPAWAAIFCLLLVLLCDSGLSVALSAAATGVALHSDRPHLFIGVYTTATDLGSALGPLFALSIGQAVGFTTLYVVIGALCLGAVARFRWLARSA